jgi:hypothetical protein
MQEVCQIDQWVLNVWNVESFPHRQLPGVIESVGLPIFDLAC